MPDGPGVVITLSAGLVLLSLMGVNYILDLQAEVLRERKKRLQLERKLLNMQTRIPRPIEAERQ